VITDAILWVSNPAALGSRVGGLSVLERQLHTLSRAGLRRVWVSTEQPAAAATGSRLPAGLEVFWNQRGAAGVPAPCQPPFLVVSGSHFIRVETLAHIARHPGGRHTAYLDAQKVSVIQVVPTPLEAQAPALEQALPEGAALTLAHPVADAATVDWLLAAGIKSADGFMARHFDRHISLAVSRALLDTQVSPNMMTVLSSLVGLLGTTFFLFHNWTAHMTGAVLVWLHSVLDGCDGELARIRFQESPLGADIDFWGDNLVHISLFGCLSLGFAHADRSVLPLIAGLTATVGILGSAILVYRLRLARRRLVEPAAAPSAGSLLARVETILEQRDFIYVLLILAYFNPDLCCTYCFMWAGAVGVTLFFAMTLYIGRLNREQELQPNRAG
jgi:phosphatidylglycerophosphate synthase